MSISNALPKHLRPRREKVFGAGRPRPLDRNANARIMAYARPFTRRTEKGKHVRYVINDKGRPARRSCQLLDHLLRNNGLAEADFVRDEEPIRSARRPTRTSGRASNRGGGKTA